MGYGYMDYTKEQIKDIIGQTNIWVKTRDGIDTLKEAWESSIKAQKQLDRDFEITDDKWRELI